MGKIFEAFVLDSHTCCASTLGNEYCPESLRVDGLMEKSTLIPLTPSEAECVDQHEIIVGQPVKIKNRHLHLSGPGDPETREQPKTLDLTDNG